MEIFDIPADQRIVARAIRSGIQKDVIRALIELIINSDDSYIRLEEKKKKHNGTIDVLYNKESSCGVFAVRDEAEGMSYDDVSYAFRKYGAATSGLKEGKSVTGFFGTGAKNALAGMTDGHICTIKDGSLVDISIYLHEGGLKGKLDGPKAVTEKIRSIQGIAQDGTVAYFKADPEKGQKVPRYDTVQEDLSNHWRLRKIMTNHSRKVWLVDLIEKEKKKRLKYTFPKGKEIANEKFSTICDSYGEFPIDLIIYRSESELRQDGDDRPGGLLIIDDHDVVLDMSLFRYDHEPLAARFFGEVKFGRFRELLTKEEPVLDEKREGLNRNHQVCKAVIAEIESRIEKLVQEESRRQKEARSKIDDEERTRYRDGFKVLNEIAEAEAEEITNLGQDPNESVQPPANGFCLYPDSAHITVNKKYCFEIRIDNSKFNPFSEVKISSNSSALEILGSKKFKVGKSKNGQIVRRFFNVQGKEAQKRVKIQASIGKNVCESTVHIEPEKEENEYLYKHGMVFHPETLTVRMNKTRRTKLRVYLKIVEADSRIKLKSDHQNVHLWPEEIIVKESDARRHVAEYDIEVWADEVDLIAMVIAETENATSEALLEVKARMDEEPERPKGRGMFSGEPHFDQEDPEPLQRISYSSETGQITIYVNFPSIRYYLGNDLRYKKSLAAQILIADLIAERCFFEMARAKKRDIAISFEALQAKIQSEAQEFSKKYGLRVHKALVDQTLLQKDQSAI